tara:strand:+ start:162 stop:299 length:138 start_codon:yes stop_codon:yes gene_type:complete
MNYLKEMNELDTGFEIIYFDDHGNEFSKRYDTYDEAIAFINTLKL